MKERELSSLLYKIPSDYCLSDPSPAEIGQGGKYQRKSCYYNLYSRKTFDDEVKPSFGEMKADPTSAHELAMNAVESLAPGLSVSGRCLT